MKRLLLFLLIVTCYCADAQPFTFVFLNKRTDLQEMPKEQLDLIMEGHMANINRLAKEGKLLAAGPFDGGGGIFIFKSNSIDEVKTWLSTDPGVQAQRWNIEILPYKPRYGSVCPVGETYVMVGYHFVRYTPNLTKYNVQDAPLSYKKHDDYLKGIIQTGNVITEGVFGEQDGGIMILQGDLKQDVIEKDPSVTEGLFIAEIKKLWIAKGSFCER
jgi:uncharacterized protein YciI